MQYDILTGQPILCCDIQKAHYFWAVGFFNNYLYACELFARRNGKMFN